jgi:hypothetical protein
MDFKSEIDRGSFSALAGPDDARAAALTAPACTKLRREIMNLSVLWFVKLKASRIRALDDINDHHNQC